MKLKEIQVTVKPSNQVKGYSAVDIRVLVDGFEKEAHELLPNTDFNDTFSQMLKTVEDIVRKEVEEIERENG
jgi:hypothetical protein